LDSMKISAPHTKSIRTDYSKKTNN